MEQKVGNVPLSVFMKATYAVIERCLALPNRVKPQYTGGHYSFMDLAHSSKNIYTLGFGHCTEEWSEMSYKMSQEKILRLLSKLPLGHFSSWQSRDRDNGQFGGAVISPVGSQGAKLGQTVLSSSSGLTEHEDEACMLVRGLILRWMTVDDIEEFVTISGNDVCGQLLCTCEDLFDVFGAYLEEVSRSV
jgi:hypothetical protein